MNVSDRVIKGDVRAVYKPTNILQDRGGDATPMPTTTADVILLEEEEDCTPAGAAEGTANSSCAGGSPTSAISGSSRQQQGCSAGTFGGEGNGGNLGIPVDTVNSSRCLHLSDPVEHTRLYAALSKKFEEY